jgi:hypothetical protein
MYICIYVNTQKYLYVYIYTYIYAFFLYVYVRYNHHMCFYKKQGILIL